MDVGAVIVLLAGVALWYVIHKWVLPYRKGSAG